MAAFKQRTRKLGIRMQDGWDAFRTTLGPANFWPDAPNADALCTPVTQDEAPLALERTAAAGADAPAATLGAAPAYVDVRGAHAPMHGSHALFDGPCRTLALCLRARSALKKACVAQLRMVITTVLKAWPSPTASCASREGLASGASISNWGLEHIDGRRDQAPVRHPACAVRDGLACCASEAQQLHPGSVCTHRATDARDCSRSGGRQRARRCPSQRDLAAAGWGRCTGCARRRCALRFHISFSFGLPMCMCLLVKAICNMILLEFRHKLLRASFTDIINACRSGARDRAAPATARRQASAVCCERQSKRADSRAEGSDGDAASGARKR